MMTCESTEPDSHRGDKKSIEDEKAQGPDTPKNCMTEEGSLPMEIDETKM